MSGLSRLRNMFRVPDLRNKILFTLLIIALYRLGSHIPTPGVDFNAVKQLEDQSREGGVLGFLALFSGLYVQMASGRDPALSSSSAQVASATSSSSTDAAPMTTQAS